MRDFCLKFTDADEMKSVLLSADFSETDNNLYHAAIALDVVATLYKLEDLNDDSSLKALPGYYVNIRVMDDALDITILEKYIVTPKTPIRVWA